MINCFWATQIHVGPRRRIEQKSVHKILLLILDICYLPDYSPARTSQIPSGVLQKNFDVLLEKFAGPKSGVVEVY